MSFWPVDLCGDPSTAPAYLKTITQTVNGSLFWKYTLKTSLLGQLLSQTGLGSVSTQNSMGTYTYTNSGTFAYDAANNLKPSSGWTYNQNNQLIAAPASGIFSPLLPSPREGEGLGLRSSKANSS